MTREEAITALGDRNNLLWGMSKEEQKYYSEALDMAISALTADVRPNIHGHWIGHREHCENLGVMPSGLGAYEWCSNCDCGIDVREWHRNDYNFCPNCGADMRGKANE